MEKQEGSKSKGNRKLLRRKENINKEKVQVSNSVEISGVSDYDLKNKKSQKRWQLRKTIYKIIKIIITSTKNIK